MKKNKTYPYTRFTVEVIKDALQRMAATVGNTPDNLKYSTLTVEHRDAVWQYDSVDEFFSDYRSVGNNASLQLSIERRYMDIFVHDDRTNVHVDGESRAKIESVFDAFESAHESCRFPAPVKPVSQPTIFIGHGRSSQWRDLKDHLQEKHGYKIEAYETGARAGHTIRDILEDMVAKSSFAVLVLSSEDEQLDGAYRARQNVIHEAGLFQGKLGFPRAIMLLEDGVEEFTNVAGVQYIKYSKSNIRETYGEVLATLRREFSA